MTTDLTDRRLAKADAQRAIRERRVKAELSQREVRAGLRDEYGNKPVRKTKTPAPAAKPARPRSERNRNPRPRVAPNTASIVDAYRRGDPVRTIARDHHVSEGTVYAHVHAAGVPVRPRVTVPDATVLAPLYEDGLSVQNLADRFGVSATAIYTRLVAAGVTMRSRGGEKRNP